MRFRFGTKRLSDLYYHRRGVGKYPEEAVAAFFKILSVIASAPDESVFYQFERLHYEKLHGKRGQAGQRSMVLHGRWRLILSIEMDEQGKEVLVLEISNHYE